jgi:hypothetical protein
MHDPEALFRLAAEYRGRAERAPTAEQGARYRSFADHCEQLASAIEQRPKGLMVRCADVLRRTIHAPKLMKNVATLLKSESS